jgi:hypothetical protein
MKRMLKPFLKPITMSQAMRKALRALERFPLVFSVAVIGTVAALWLNHLPPTEMDARATAGNLMMASWLGVGLLFSLAILSESRRWPLWAAGLSQLGGIGVLALFHHSIVHASYSVRLSRFWLGMLTVHLFAALASAMARRATPDSFWRFNQKLAARLGLSLGYVFLMYVGLSVALASVKSLFEVDFPDGWFLDSGIFALGVFNTWFFLAGVPGGRAAFGPAGGGLAGSAGDAFVEAAKDFAYPRQLRVLVQLILLPLVGVYLFIVYAYAVRTLMIWEWPTGWVTYLLLCFCALGLLCLFLAQPLADHAGNRWMQAYCRHFHLALFPVLILLFAAIGKRVQEYGITENRYFVLALGVWLTGIVLHSALEAPRDLRVLPASLCLVALLASFGPWGAFEVSRKSQEARLKSMLETQGMLVGGKLAKAPGRIPRMTAREIAGVADYLEERELLSDLKPWIPDMDDSGQTHSVAWHKALDGKFALLEALELPYMPPEATGPGRAETVAFSCRTLASPMRYVSGYDFLYADYRPRQETASSMPAGEEFHFDFDTASGELRFHSKDTLGPVIDLGAHFQSLRDRYPDAYNLNLPEGEMTLDAEDKSLKVQVKLRDLNGQADPVGARLKGFSADIFIEVKGRQRARPKNALARVQTGKAAASKPDP